MYYYTDNFIDLFLLILIIVLPLIANIKIKCSYKKYSKINNAAKLSGKDVANKILEKNGINASVEKIGGNLTDHYNPKAKNICLSTNVYDDCSISAIAIAAHECGHAIQDKEAYSFFNFRSALVPVVNVTSRISYIFVILGFILEFAGLLEVGIILLCVGLLFQLVTLPVEFNASKRAKEQLFELGLISDTEIYGVKKVLSAAALTYVAGVLTESLQILRLVLLSRRKN